MATKFTPTHTANGLPVQMFSSWRVHASDRKLSWVMMRCVDASGIIHEARADHFTKAA